jgi:hypothetical protein
MKGKEVSLYRQMIKKLKERVFQVSGLHFNPAQVIVDFEILLKSAIETELPLALVKGCYFHFTQSIWRKVSKLGLAVPYKTDRKVFEFVRRLLSMAYLPTAFVRQNFNLVHASNTVRRLVIQYPVLGDLIRYFDLNYINGQFPPPVWNVFNRDSTSRTNNHVEGISFQQCFLKRSISYLALVVVACFIPCTYH